MAKGDKTADQLLSELEADPAWVARREAQETATSAKEASYLRDEKPLRAELHQLGYPVKWVWDLVNSSQSYADAIPVLIRHIELPYGDDVREGIARALAVKEAHGIAGQAIVRMLRVSGLGDQLRWALANTLVVVGSSADKPAILELLDVEQDPEVAKRLVRALSKAGST